MKPKNLDELISSLKKLNEEPDIVTNQLITLYKEGKDFLSRIEHSTDKLELSLNLNSLVFKHEKELASRVRNILSEYTDCLAEYSSNHNDIEQKGVIAGPKLIKRNEALKNKMAELQDVYKNKIKPDVGVFIAGITDRGSILSKIYESSERAFKIQPNNDYSQSKKSFSNGRKRIRKTLAVIATTAVLGFGGHHVYQNFDHYKIKATMNAVETMTYIDKKINGTPQDQELKALNAKYDDALTAYENGQIAKADSLIQELKNECNTN